MWTCPKCGRTFKRKDQQHTCTLISKESLFLKRPPELKRLYEKIAQQITKLGDYREETVNPDVIFFKTKSTFLAIKVKKDHLDIEFFLDHLENVPPVSKYLQTSKHRVAHVVPIDSEEEINDQLIVWIKSSYLLVSK
jgi:predicted transport protein